VADQPGDFVAQQVLLDLAVRRHGKIVTPLARVLREIVVERAVGPRPAATWRFIVSAS
jgi:hypothetical protein